MTAASGALDVSLANPLRVVIAGPQAAQTGIRSGVERAGFAVVADCRDGVTATAAVVRERADLCLIGADLPGALEAVAAITSLPLAPKVVVVGEVAHVKTFFAALELGASGYLPDDLEPARVADELRGVAEGAIALAPATAASLLEQGRPATAAALTDREAKVLELLAAGLTTKEIALRLRVTSTAVRRHVSSAVERLEAARRPWTDAAKGSELMVLRTNEEGEE